MRSIVFQRTLSSCCSWIWLQSGCFSLRSRETSWLKSRKLEAGRLGAFGSFSFLALVGAAAASGIVLTDWVSAAADAAARPLYSSASFL